MYDFNKYFGAVRRIFSGEDLPLHSTRYAMVLSFCSFREFSHTLKCEYLHVCTTFEENVDIEKLYS